MDINTQKKSKPIFSASDFTEPVYGANYSNTKPNPIPKNTNVNTNPNTVSYSDHLKNSGDTSESTLLNLETLASTGSQIAKQELLSYKNNQPKEDNNIYYGGQTKPIISTGQRNPLPAIKQTPLTEEEKQQYSSLNLPQQGMINEGDLRKQQRLETISKLMESTVTGEGAGGFLNPVGAVIQGVKQGGEQVGKGIKQTDWRDLLSKLNTAGYSGLGELNPETTTGMLNIASGAFKVGMSLYPELAASNMVNIYASPVAEYIGEQIGGKKGKEIAGIISQIGTTSPMGLPMTLGIIANIGGSKLTDKVLEGKKLTPDEKSLISEAVGQLSFVAGAALGGGIEGVRENRKNLPAEDRINQNLDKINKLQNQIKENQNVSSIGKTAQGNGNSRTQPAGTERPEQGIKENEATTASRLRTDEGKGSSNVNEEKTAAQTGTEGKQKQANLTNDERLNELNRRAEELKQRLTERNKSIEPSQGFEQVKPLSQRIDEQTPQSEQPGIEGVKTFNEKKADIESRRKAELDKAGNHFGNRMDINAKYDQELEDYLHTNKEGLDELRNNELEKINENHPDNWGKSWDIGDGREKQNHTGQEYVDGMKVEAKFVDMGGYEPDVKNPYEMIIHTNKPSIYKDGVLEKTGKVDVGKFRDKQSAMEWLDKQEPKSLERINKKNEKVNTKYDKEVSDLESQPTNDKLTPTEQAQAMPESQNKENLSQGKQVTEVAPKVTNVTGQLPKGENLQNKSGGLTTEEAMPLMEKENDRGIEALHKLWAKEIQPDEYHKIHQDVENKKAEIASRIKNAQTESNKQSVDANEKINKSMENARGFKKVHVAGLRTSLKDFQGRGEAYSKQTYDRIIKDVEDGTFNESSMPPVQIWWNKEKGGYEILAGHSRTKAYSDILSGKVLDENGNLRDVRLPAGMKKTDFAKINSQIVDAKSLNEAKRIAQESNSGAQQTDIENANYFRNVRNSLTTKKAIEEKAKNLYGNNAQRIVDYSHLNPDGDASNSLKTFDKSQSNESKDALKNIAQYVGRARRNFPELSDAQENEMFNYLKNGAFDKLNQGEFNDRIGNIVNRPEFDSNNPLNLENRVTKGNNQLKVESKINDTLRQIKDLENERKSSNVSESRLKDISNEIGFLNKDLVNFRQQLSGAKEADSRQTDLFADIQDHIKNKEIDNEQAREFADKSEAESASIEPVVKDIESKANSDTEEQRNEAIQKADGLIKSKVTPTEQPQNRLISEESYRNAQNELKKNLGKLSAGIDPTNLKHLAVVGGYHFENGLRKFSDWSRKMIEDVGEKIKPYLRDLWEKSKAEYDLITVHNLNQHNLIFADKMGGLAMPSMAIVKDKYGFSKYGDISLIVDPEQIDPLYGGKVYNRDIYSPTYPTVYRYTDKKLFDKKLDEVYKSLPPEIQQSFDEQYNLKEKIGKGDYSISDIGDSSDLLKAYYLKKTGQLPDLIYKDQPLSSRDIPEWDGQYEAAERLIKKYPILTESYTPTPEEIKTEADKIRATATNDYYKGDFANVHAEEILKENHNKEVDKAAWQFRDDIVKEYLKQFEDDKNFRKAQRDLWKNHHHFDAYSLRKDIQKLLNPKKELDWYEYKYEGLRPLIEAQTDKYHQFLEDEFGKVFGDEYLLNGRKKVPNTLNNAVDIMGNKLVGAEKTMVEGLGKSATKSAKQFSSLGDIAKSKDQIVSEQKFDKAEEKLRDNFDKLSDKLSSYYKTKEFGFERLDDLSKTIGNIAKSGRKIGDNIIRRELLKNGYGKVPNYYYDAIGDVAKEMKEMPTQYFEAKDGDIVRLNEFKGAVVPQDASSKVRQILKDNGVQRILTYERDNEQSRINALNEFNEAKFGGKVDESAYKEAKNKLFTEDEATKRADNLFNKYSNKIVGDEPKPFKDFFNKSDLEDLAYIGGYFVEKGLRNFADWSKAMVGKVGDSIKPYLNDIWDHVKTTSPDLFKAENKAEDKSPINQIGNIAGISQRVRDARADLTKTPASERGIGWTAQEALDRGNYLIRNGIKPDDVINEFNKTGKVSDDDIAVLRAQAHELQKSTNRTADDYGIKSNEYKEALKKENDFLDRVKPFQTQSSRIFSAQQGAEIIDMNSKNGIIRYFRDTNKKEPTELQTAKIKELSDTNKRLNDVLGSKEAELQDIIKKYADALDKRERQSGKPSIKISSKELADKIRRNAKIHKPGAFYSATPASLVWDAGVETVAQTIEQGGKLVDAIQKGIEKIKESDWYKGLNAEKQKEAERQFRDWHQNQSTVKYNLADLQKEFADKKDNKFTMDQTNRIWQYAKDNYIDEGKGDFKDMINNVSQDLGLRPDQVRDAITQPKSIRTLTDDMYRIQNKRRLALRQAETWVRNANTPGWEKFVSSLPSRFFGWYVFGHGTVFGITHAGMELFRPTAWRNYFPAMIRQFKYAYGDPALYEKGIEDLQNRPNYILAKRAGLANDPSKVYDDYMLSDKYFGKLGLTGERGFNSWKIYRQDMFDNIWDHLSDAAKSDKNTAKALAEIINHSTGTADVMFPKSFNTAFFAPRLEASRWIRLFAEPAKAVKTFLDWKNASSADKFAAKLISKRAGEMLATYSLMLAANEGINLLTGSKQHVNYSDPTKSDWMRFKVNGKVIDVSGGMLSTTTFVARMLEAAIGSEKTTNQLSRGKGRANLMMQDFGKYLQGKLSPIAGTTFAMASHHDYAGNTLPPFNDKPLYKDAKHLSWAEYLLTEQMPIPVSEGIRYVYDTMESKGMSKPQIETILNGIFVSAVAGGTGARIRDEYKNEYGKNSKVGGKQMDINKMLNRSLNKSSNINKQLDRLKLYGQ